MYSVENIVKQLVEMGFEKDLIISTIKRIRLTNGMYPYTDFFHDLQCFSKRNLHSLDRNIK